MRRLALLIGVLGVTGCAALRDAFSTHADVAAMADGQELTVDRLAELASQVKQLQLEYPAVEQIANVWVDNMLFAEQLAGGNTLTDTATAAAAMWPMVAQLRWEHLHERLLAKDTTLTAAQVDSAYNAGDTRLFQHILIMVPPSASPVVEKQKRAQIERLLPQASARGGAAFGKVAAQYSEDPGSKANQGYLGLSIRGQFVQQFEDAAWQLPPGGVTAVVRTPFGFHIIRRPPLAEVKDSFRFDLQSRVATRFDSLYLDDLAKNRKLSAAADAPAVVRQAMGDPSSARRDGTSLVSYRGGKLRVRDMMRWVYSLPPENAQALPYASDDQIKQFLKIIAQREILLLQADSAHVQLRPEDWHQIIAQHDTLVAGLAGALGLTQQALRDSASTPAQRAAFAAGHVNDYMDRLVQQRASYVPISPFFSDALRHGASWSLSSPGVQRAADRAKGLRAAADSLRARGGGPIRPAPGPAPTVTPPKQSLQ
jgi:hypothetical protein